MAREMRILWFLVKALFHSVEHPVRLGQAQFATDLTSDLDPRTLFPPNKSVRRPIPDYLGANQWRRTCISRNCNCNRELAFNVSLVYVYVCKTSYGCGHLSLNRYGWLHHERPMLYLPLFLLFVFMPLVEVRFSQSMSTAHLLLTRGNYCVLQFTNLNESLVQHWSCVLDIGRVIFRSAHGIIFTCSWPNVR